MSRFKGQPPFDQHPAPSRQPALCGECGVIHRPGENTCCPGWRPGPFVPSPQPEMPEGWVKIATAQSERTIAGDVWMPLVALKVALAAQGLHVIDAKQKAVLDAMAAVPDIQIDMTLDLREDLSIQETRVWEAELEVRRAARRKP